MGYCGRHFQNGIDVAMRRPVCGCTSGREETRCHDYCNKADTSPRKNLNNDGKTHSSSGTGSCKELILDWITSWEGCESQTNRTWALSEALWNSQRTNTELPGLLRMSV